MQTSVAPENCSSRKRNFRKGLQKMGNEAGHYTSLKDIVSKNNYK